MTIKIEISLTNNWLYSLGLITLFLIFGFGVYAYNSNSNPSVFGHSSNEVNVVMNGNIMTLQQAIDEQKIGNTINKPQFDSGWFDVSTNGGYDFSSYTINHNLGTKDYIYKIFYRKDSTSKQYLASDFGCPYRNTWNGRCTGAVGVNLGENILEIKTGTWVSGLGAYRSEDDSIFGQHRVLIWKLS